MRTLAMLVLAALVLSSIGCEGRRWSDLARKQERRDRPKVPYIVNPKSEAPQVVLWRDAERSDKKGIAYVAKGTKCKILDYKELARTRGGTMYLVQAKTGEKGWIPQFCIEYRRR